MDDDDANVKRLPVRFKHPMPDDRSVVRPHEVGRYDACDHWRVVYIVDEKKNTVECGKCGADLNPIWALGQLASRDSLFHETAKRYQEEMRRLDERERTKCENCGKMTRISRR
jgi:ribosomal protein S27AE